MQSECKQTIITIITLMLNMCINYCTYSIFVQVPLPPQVCLHTSNDVLFVTGSAKALHVCMQILTFNFYMIGCNVAKMSLSVQNFFSFILVQRHQ